MSRIFNLRSLAATLAFRLTVSTTLTLGLCGTASAADCAAKTSDSQFGTTITWHKSARAAARIAQEQDKLLFLIHVSGDFSVPDFT